VSAGEQHVLWFEIAMHHAGVVRVSQCVGQLPRESHGLADWKCAVTRQAGAQRLTGDIRHDVKQPAVELPRVVDAEDVGMGESRRDVNLAQKALGAVGRDVRFEYLDGDLPVVAEIARQVDDRHAATAELSLDDVPICDRGA
jgi:hypothetical protein